MLWVRHHLMDETFWMPDGGMDHEQPRYWKVQSILMGLPPKIIKEIELALTTSSDPDLSSVATDEENESVSSHTSNTERDKWDITNHERLCLAIATATTWGHRMLCHCKRQETNDKRLIYAKLGQAFMTLVDRALQQHEKLADLTELLHGALASYEKTTGTTTPSWRTDSQTYHSSSSSGERTSGASTNRITTPTTPSPRSSPSPETIEAAEQLGLYRLTENNHPRWLEKTAASLTSETTPTLSHDPASIVGVAAPTRGEWDPHLYPMAQPRGPPAPSMPPFATWRPVMSANSIAMTGTPWHYQPPGIHPAQLGGPAIPAQPAEPPRNPSIFIRPTTTATHGQGPATRIWSPLQSPPKPVEPIPVRVLRPTPTPLGTFAATPGLSLSHCDHPNCPWTVTRPHPGSPYPTSTPEPHPSHPRPRVVVQPSFAQDPQPEDLRRRQLETEMR
jgi:hypothetical protein